tara:strand:- start:4634 stop:4828 length:195 start_codon:yes stop_codon:yes gene_type:complete
MINFVQQQLDASNRLFKAMQDDHLERIRDMSMWSETSMSLIKKLAERDKTIEQLRAEIKALKAK